MLGPNQINVIRMLDTKDVAKHDSTEKLYYYMIIAEQILWIFIITLLVSERSMLI